MKSLNEVRLLGYIGQEPELRYTSGGTPVCTISVATTAKWKDKHTGEDAERTEWHRVVIWQALAEAVSKHLEKGSPVLVSGTLRYNEYADRETGKKIKQAEVVADDVIFLPNGKGGGAR